MNTKLTSDELREAYEAYFKSRMEDEAFSRYVYSLGYSLTGLHNMLFTFFEAGIQAAKQ